MRCPFGPITVPMSFGVNVNSFGEARNISDNLAEQYVCLAPRMGSRLDDHKTICPEWGNGLQAERRPRDHRQYADQ